MPELGDQSPSNLSPIQDAFSDFVLFFYDKHGGEVIGVLWKPSGFEPQPFKVSLSVFELGHFLFLADIFCARTDEVLFFLLNQTVGLASLCPSLAPWDLELSACEAVELSLQNISGTRSLLRTLAAGVQRQGGRAA